MTISPFPPLGVYTVNGWATINFWVPGHAKTKGSMDHKGRGRMVQNVAGSADWARMVEHEARRAMATGWTSLLLDVHVMITYYLPVTLEQLIRQGSGDIDKLERNILDAMTKAQVYLDDAQVTQCIHEKRSAFADQHPQGVKVSVTGKVM